jgi:multidrug resistance efflux pump
MLNISKHSINERIDQSKFTAFSKTSRFAITRKFSMWFGIFLIMGIIVLFLPWTQNVEAYGKVTALKPEQRPQTIHSTIPGRIEKWYVQEGQFVHKGDTILFISEIKDEYFDPQLLRRTEDQVKMKEQSITSYQDKVNALNKQIDALNEGLILKLEQTRNKIKQSELKVKSDSIDLEAAKTGLTIAQEQFNRYEELRKKDVITQTELEGRKLKYQEALAKKISAENKLMTARNELINSMIELNSIEMEYNDKLMKAESDKYSAMSTMFDAEAAVTKLQGQFSNYAVRTGYYFITAPQDGYVTKALTSGVGETIKEGTAVVSLAPAKVELAVEMYVEPIDLPLIRVGQKTRFIFDGWPSFVFSGWPGASFGTFGGEVVAIDNLISENGKYRVLVKPDHSDVPWPTALRVGAGAKGMMMLQDVPLWYEMWRKLNGFPPQFYEPAETKKDESKSAKK